MGLKPLFLTTPVREVTVRAGVEEVEKGMVGDVGARGWGWWDTCEDGMHVERERLSHTCAGIRTRRLVREMHPIGDKERYFDNGIDDMPREDLASFLITRPRELLRRDDLPRKEKVTKPKGGL